MDPKVLELKALIDEHKKTCYRKSECLVCKAALYCPLMCIQCNLCGVAYAISELKIRAYYCYCKKTSTDICDKCYYKQRRPTKVTAYNPMLYSQLYCESCNLFPSITPTTLTKRIKSKK